MNRRRRNEVVVREDPVVVSDDLALLLRELDQRGRPEFRYRIIDRIRLERDIDQAELYRELYAETHGEAPEDVEVADSAEDASDASEVKEDPTGAAGGDTEVPHLPEIPEDAGRNDLVAYAQEHLNLELPGNISKADALDAIHVEIGSRTAALEGN